MVHDEHNNEACGVACFIEVSPTEVSLRDPHVKRLGAASPLGSRHRAPAVLARQRIRNQNATSSERALGTGLIYRPDYDALLSITKTIRGTSDRDP
jgi:hypothetical protein